MEWRLGMLALMVGLFGLVGAGCAPSGRRRLRAWLSTVPHGQGHGGCLHGLPQHKEMQRGPVLDGLPAWYLEAQLKNIKRGAR